MKVSPVPRSSHGQSRHVKYDVIPGVPCIPAVGVVVGKTEVRAGPGRRCVILGQISRPPMAVPSHRPLTVSEGSRRCETDRVLGVILSAREAGEMDPLGRGRLGILAVLLRDLARTCHAHADAFRSHQGAALFRSASGHP